MLISLLYFSFSYFLGFSLIMSALHLLVVSLLIVFGATEGMVRLFCSRKFLNQKARKFEKEILSSSEKKDPAPGSLYQRYNISLISHSLCLILEKDKRH